jgi:hypothetical protein
VGVEPIISAFPSDPFSFVLATLYHLLLALSIGEC